MYRKARITFQSLSALPCKRLLSVHTCNRLEQPTECSSKVSRAGEKKTVWSLSSSSTLTHCGSRGGQLIVQSLFQAGLAPMAEARTLHHEGFLLLRNDNFKNAQRITTSVRTFCRVEGSELRCWCDSGSGDLLGRHGHGKKPTHFLELQECVEIFVPPTTIEESITKCALRKKQHDPLIFELVMHRSPSCPRQRLRFMAEAGGGVRKWVAILRTAIWIGRPLISALEILRLPAPRPTRTTIVKVLLDLALHPERVKLVSKARQEFKSKRAEEKNQAEEKVSYLGPRTCVAHQKECPRGVVFVMDIQKSTGDDVRRRLGALSGLPPQCFTLWQRSSESGAPLHRLLDGCWQKPLEEWLKCDAKCRAVVFAGLVEEDSFVSLSCFAPKPTLISIYTVGRFSVSSQVCR